MRNLNFHAFLIFTIATFSFSCNKNSIASDKNTDISAQQWEEDLQELYTQLKSNHRDLYHATNAETFDDLFLEIKEAIPQLSESEIIVKLTQFAALANDGHTRLTIPLQEGLGLNQAHSKTPLPADSNLVFRSLPVSFYWFDDGVYITKATAPHQDLIGRKVIKINQTPIEKALAMIRPICHYDNEYGYKLIAPSKLNLYEVLASLKIATSPENITLTIQEGAQQRQVNISALSRFPNISFGDSSSSLENELPILSKQKNEQYYWYEYMPEIKAIYLQINQMNDAEEGPDLIKFIGQLDQFIEDNDVNRLILDLRNNFGGDNTYSPSIVDLLLKNPKLNEIGSFYTLIGRKTFSAAQYLVNDLRKWTNVIFVGEPTGASPNSFGDSKKVQLPNSNLTVRISTIYWRDYTGDEQREWIAPDIPVLNNGPDHFNNQDLAFRTCLTYKAGNNLMDTYSDLYRSGGRETAIRLYLRIALDWDRHPDEVSEIESQLVEWMSEQNED